jgi:hypothetical protein
LTVLLVGYQWLGTRLVATMLPTFRSMIEFLDGRFVQVGADLARTGADTVVRVRAKLAIAVSVGGRTAFPDPRSRIEVSTPTGAVLQAAIIAIAILAAWPVRQCREPFVRAAIGLPWICLIVFLDIPLVLLGELNESLIEATAPGTFSVAVLWKDFLQAGGRFAMAIAAAVATIGMSDSLLCRRRAEIPSRMDRQK